MLGFVCLIASILMIVLSVIIAHLLEDDVLETVPSAILCIIGICGIIVGFFWGSMFIINRVGYTKYLLEMDQKKELITTKLDMLTSNILSIKELSDTYDSAIDYNKDLYQEQLAYKYYGFWLNYHDERILEKTQIDLSKYNVKSTTIHISNKEQE